MPTKKAPVKKATRKTKVEEVTHLEIYQRVVEVEGKIETLNTRITGLEIGISEVLRVFTAAKGAFEVLTFIGKLAKPFALIALAIGAVAAAWSQFWKH